METKESTSDLTIKLLWNQANAIPQENQTTQLLRSFYLTTCKKIAKRDVQLPALRFTPSVMCPKCSSIWPESKFSLALKSLRIHSHKAEKLVDKLDNDQKSLTRKQKKRAKWLKKKICKNVEITCGFCQKKTRQVLINKKVKTITDNNQPEIDIPTKKKKKKKDKSAGLKLDKIILNGKKPHQPVNAKKTAKPKQQPSKANKEKAVSKTQKQNSILLLAKMLKNQNSNAPTKPNNQLEKLLR